MSKILIKNVKVINEGRSFHADILMGDQRILKIDQIIDNKYNAREINGENKYLLPGVIDDQVHFREPGLTHKASIHSESIAAVAGGTTSFMEMPNTKPPALTQELLEEKYAIAANSSPANYSFFMGTSNDNADEVLKTNDKRNEICGIKIFMGSSTGNMLVDNHLALDKIFREAEVLIATHCEDERLIKRNLDMITNQKSHLEASDHPIIRDAEVCFESSLMAVQLAKRNNTRLHILHISTAKELQLFTNLIPLEEKRITAEVCVHHLHFTADDYATLGNKIKCNPAIKSPENRIALWEALLDDRLDIIATDHAPHTTEEKSGDYSHAHAGLPLVQHSLLLMLHYVKEGRISIEKLVEKMSHAPAKCFQIKERGFIREGYFADLVLINNDAPYTISKENILYKCGWSPLEGFTSPYSIDKTFVNGYPVYENGKVDASYRGMRLQFNRN
jgi:dihydroorotase